MKRNVCFILRLDIKTNFVLETEKGPSGNARAFFVSKFRVLMEEMIKNSTLSYNKMIWSLGVGTSLLVLQIYLGQILPTLETAYVPLPMKQESKWNPTLFKTLSFGHHSLAVDWLLIRFLSDPALEHVSEGEHPPAYYDLDLATDIDPLFFDFYWAGSYKLAIVRDDVAGAEELIKKGLRTYKNGLPSEEFKNTQWWEVWQLYQVLGYIYLMEKGDLALAQQVFEEAAELPHVPGYIKDLAKKFRQPGGAYLVGMTITDFLLRKADNEEDQQKLLEKRKSLYLGQVLTQANQEFEKYLTSQIKVSRSKLVPAKLQEYFEHFIREKNLRPTDEWGGKIYLNDQGKITTTTPRQSVMGLE